MKMKHTLTRSELGCLSKISEPGGDHFKPCPVQTLIKLARLGLIEEVVVEWLPLEMQRHRYRLTSLGDQVLSEALHD